MASRNMLSAYECVRKYAPDYGEIVEEAGGVGGMDAVPEAGVRLLLEQPTFDTGEELQVKAGVRLLCPPSPHCQQD